MRAKRNKRLSLYLTEDQHHSIERLKTMFEDELSVFPIVSTNAFMAMLIEKGITSLHKSMRQLNQHPV